ncbi:hypothetical protein Mevan_0104 [Methanococcus vannielii SB]|uniref:Uncharacterized protein n=1 Tax=Methanococcus vannielii (strain ATCC 35089 / DSM 1224 / JCM 13029 / OCM 148 / SB) TaxID=406327 RepID=A6UNE5_METVS|nr:hypothetical protein [Methanococcus vannielii]ABR54017.1 hypothetical protein Mevan_0104 [Methanococcus vannielii SB]
MKYVISFGTVPGYGSNDGSVVAEKVAEDLKNILFKIQEKTEVYPSGVLSLGKAIYSTEWGCPIGGEDIFVYSGSHNPEFSDIEKWQDAVLLLAKEIKSHFKQSTVTIDWIESKITYLKD